MWVYLADTRSVGSPSLILLPVSLPALWLPWISSQDSVIPDHFFEFSKTRVWGRKWSVRELRRERKKRPIPCFFSCSSLDMFCSFPPKDLCTPCALCHASLISNILTQEGPSTTLLTQQSHQPNLPEILLFIVTTCFQKYLYETPPNESISSVRADIALSGGKAGVTRWEVDRYKRVKGSISSQRDSWLMGQRKVTQTNS